MAHPVFWPHKTFFYPIGNTPPVLLTQFLASKENTKALLLGCGDPRNILYTLYASGADTLEGASLEERTLGAMLMLCAETRTFDFTCVDIEGAIHARNMILFTLIMDDCYPKNDVQVWNIFYHFFLDKDSLSLLISQCRKLLELSQDMEAWNAGPYSRVLRICSSFTLSELRRYWTAYATTDTTGPFKRRFMAGMNDAREKMGDGMLIRSAGPLLTKSFKSLRRACRHFWKTGVMSEDTKVVTSATHVNPMFAYSIQGDGFVTHYGTMPAAAFPIAPAFAQLRASLPTSTSFPKNDLYGTMHDQFRSWCTTFRHAALYVGQKSKVIIRILVGDVLSCCYTLQHYAYSRTTTAQHRVAPWNAEPLVLDGLDYETEGDAIPPRTFNVIDTSNLADHIGIVNILVAATPLLSRTSTSTLNTETLLLYGKDSDTAFATSLCGDITTMSILLDITPCSYVSNFSTISNIHEILLYKSTMLGGQFHDRVTWKIPSLMDDQNGPHRLAFEAKAFGELLFNIYLKMFHFEDMTAKFQNLSVETIRDSERVHYSRLSLALLLQAVMKNVTADWSDVIRALLDLIEQDRSLILGSNNYQDLLCHLHVLGIYSCNNFNVPGVDESAMVRDIVKGLRAWDVIPPLICVTLLVPLKELQAISDELRLNPNMNMLVHSGRFVNVFTPIQTAVGTITGTVEAGTQPVYIQEDPNGTKGNSFLIVSCWVRAWILTVAPNHTVALALQSTGNTAKLAMQGKLGLNLELYGSSLENSRNVLLTHQPPTKFSQRGSLTAPMFGAPISSGGCDTSSSATNRAGVISTMACRVVVTCPDAQAQLANRSVELKATQVSSCKMLLHVGAALRQEVAYPFPIQGAQAKLRIARKSHYVEIVVSPAGPSVPGGMAMNRFPVVRNGGNTVAWNMHRVNMDRLPLLDISQTEQLDWLNPAVSGMFSDSDRTAREGRAERDLVLGDLYDMKDS
ncbi:unnamed protein product [Somion occarium]|uniref:DUF4470 domain-containing protein n=1 Tax=Somion occarium TaxID=3059160 RepID=A0ABP1D5S6_9APHY